MVSIQRETVRGRLSSEHAAQHRQSLNVTHLTVVIQTGHTNTQAFSVDWFNSFTWTPSLFLSVKHFFILTRDL